MSAENRLYYDAEGFAITIGYERHGPVSPLRDALERTKRLICRSLDYPVREMSDMLLAEALKGVCDALASAGEAGTATTTKIGVVHEHAVPKADAHTQSSHGEQAK